MKVVGGGGRGQLGRGTDKKRVGRRGRGRSWGKGGGEGELYMRLIRLGPTFKREGPTFKREGPTFKGDIHKFTCVNEIENYRDASHLKKKVEKRAGPS